MQLHENMQNNVISANEAGTYVNPILHADYSDPDVIRVGSDFYLVSSSFNHMPGLPLLHSKDLVNWRIVNHIVKRLDLPGYDKPQHGKGIWAPSLRYHADCFWVFFSTPDEGIFMSKAVDPLGDWSTPHLIQAAKGWIDPCPFWDDNGEAYLVHAFAQSRSGIKHKLQLFAMAQNGTSLLGEGRIIYDGTDNHPTLEGPKVYKRRGYYYIFAPAGGVETGWQTILRSKHIYGPFEDKIVLHQGGTDINGPHQGGWVELESGESWFVHFQDKAAYGRIVHLQPVDWVDDWPLMGGNRDDSGLGEPVHVWKKPNAGKAAALQPQTAPAASDDFTEGIGLQWQWQANPQEAWYEIGAAPHRLRLFAVSLPDKDGTLYDAPQLLMQKFPALAFSATCQLKLVPNQASDCAGLIIFGQIYRYISLRADDKEAWQIGLYEGDGTTEIQLAEAGTSQLDGSVYFRVNVREGGMALFSYSWNNENFVPLGDEFKATAGKWVGAKVGIFAASMGMAGSQGYADFEWFKVEEGS